MLACWANFCTGCNLKYFIAMQIPALSLLDSMGDCRVGLCLVPGAHASLTSCSRLLAETICDQPKPMATPCHGPTQMRCTQGIGMLCETLCNSKLNFAVKQTFDAEW